MGDFAERRGGYEPENYLISPEDRLGHGGAKTKFADNIAAIRLLKDLQERKVDVAGPDDKKILVRYVGWGGLPQAFDAVTKNGLRNIRNCKTCSRRTNTPRPADPHRTPILPLKPSSGVCTRA